MAHSALNEEQALIEGLKTGNEQSYKEAVRTFTPGMLAVARVLSGQFQCRRDCPGLLGHSY